MTAERLLLDFLDGLSRLARETAVQLRGLGTTAQGPALAADSARQDAPGTPTEAPLTAEQRAYLLDLASRKGALDQYELAINAATTAAEGRELREALRALPDPVSVPAQRRGA